MVFDNRSNYDYYFIIKELVKDFERELYCVGKNTKKYKTFLVLITKEVKRIVDTPRFMACSFSNLFNDLAEGIHKIKCKHGHD